MKKAINSKIVLLVLITLIFAGCASSTLFQTYPPGAKVYINGEPVGKTPYLYTDTKIVGSVTNVDLLKEGYEPLYTSIQRNEQVDVGAVIGGFFLGGIPFLWTLQYNPTHNYELIPIQNLQNKEVNVSIPESTEQIVQPSAVPSNAQRLKELKQLLDEKLINNEDYEKQKQKILDEI